MFSKWIEQVLKPYRQGKPRCLMILDSASAHKSVQSKAVLEETNMELSIIPGGYTAVLQTLDVGVMKLFKTYYEELCQKFLVDHPDGKISRLHVANWVSMAWARINPDAILNTWRRIGIRASPSTY